MNCYFGVWWADFGLFRTRIDRVLWEAVLKGKGRLDILQEGNLKVQEQAVSI